MWAAWNCPEYTEKTGKDRQKGKERGWVNGSPLQLSEEDKLQRGPKRKGTHFL